MRELSDADLDAVLHSVGEHLEVGGGRADATERLADHTDRQRPMLRSAAVLLAVVLAATVAVAPVRRTLAGWLWIGHTEITATVAEGSDSLPELTDGSEPITRAEAAATGIPVDAIGATPLGDPERWARPVEGGVLALWSEGSTTLWIRSADGDTGVLLRKLVGADADVRRIAGLGDAALSIRGDHVLQTPARRVGAGTVVLWTDAGLEHRLESHLRLDRMVDVAGAIDEAT